VVVLKRLDDAVAAGDPVVGVIRGMAMNQDGRSVSLTAPSRPAQMQVVADAIADAGITPADVGFIETHGTGTALGDPIECHALADVFAGKRPGPLMLGAVKSNIGHLGPAAGIAGLIKAVLAVQSGSVPPNLHFRSINPEISTGKLDLDFPLEVQDFPEQNGARIAGVSSFGFSGTNVHLVLENFEAGSSEQDPADVPMVLALSARTRPALEETLRRMDRCLRDEPEFAAVCRSAAFGRNAFEHRLAVVARNAREAQSALQANTGRKALARPRLALAIHGLEALDIAWLRSAGIEPYALIGNSGQPVPGGLPADLPLLDPGDGEALALSLADLGVNIVMAAREAAYPGADGLTLVETDPADEQDKLRLLAALFELGFDVDWKPVLPEGRRLALPVTPFQRKRYWREARKPVAAPAGLPGHAVIGPLPGHQFHLATGLTRHPFLADHRVHGRVLVPGAFHIACLMLAAKGAGHAGLALENILFPHPLIVPESGDLSVWTKVEMNGTASLMSRDEVNEWVTHGQADVAGSGSSSETLDLPAIAARCTDILDGAAWREELAGLGIEVGPAFSGLVRMRRGDGEALAEVTPPEGRLNLDGTIHPAFLDACLQTAGGALPEEARGRTLLPIGIERFEMFHLPDGPVRVFARIRDVGPVIGIDLDIADRDGNVFMRVEGLNVSPADKLEQRADPLRDLFHHLGWQDPDAGPVPGDKAGADDVPLLVLADGMEEAAELAAAFGERAVLAITGDELKQDASGIWRYREGELENLIAECGPVDHIVDCHGGRNGRVHLDRALGLASFAAGLDAPPRVTFAIHGSDPDPICEALAGLGATLALEQPQARSRFVTADTLAALAAETRRSGPEDRVRIRGGARKVARLLPVPAPAEGLPHLTGSVLITGGFGGFGRALARWVLDRGAQAVILAGRHPDPEFADGLARDTGRQVEAVEADCSKPAEIERLLAGIGHLPPLRAIYHAAGAQAPGPLANLTRAQFADSFDAKALGAIALDAATQMLALDEFVVISSIASLLGAAGQGGYAPANAVLDGLVRRRRAAGLPGLSVAFGRLEGGGMTRDLDARANARLDALGISALSIDTALEALGRSLSDGLVDPFIARIDWQTYSERHPAGLLPPCLAHLAAGEDPVPETGGSLEQIVTSEIRLVAGLGAGRAIDAERTLVQLGFDSLMGMELRNRLRRRFGKAPSIATILGGGTVTDLLQTFEETPTREDEWEDMVL
jgi:acyl transferase domain-containing protein/aryl carrier-like protein